MNPKKSVLILLSLFFVGTVGGYLLQFFGVAHPILTNSLFLIPPALAVISGIYATRTYHTSNSHGQVMALLTLGLFCWFIGEVIFYYYQFTTLTDPFPSIADAFYLSAYPLLLIGLVKESMTHHANWKTIRDSNRLVLTLSSFLILAVAFIVLYFGVFIAYDSEMSMLSNAIAISYGLGDLLLLIPVLFILKMVLDFKGGKLFYSWAIILSGIFCIMLGDILFAINSEAYQNLEPLYTLIDIAWIAGYLLFAYSFFFTAKTIRELQSTLRQSNKSK